LFPVDDVPALADAMERLAVDPQLRARCAMAARTRVVERFAGEIIGRQIIELYRIMISRL
jgi:glycosyltransferase involved in cell wall biosynthesis